MTERIKYPHLMRLDDFHAWDPHEDSLDYMADAVNYTHHILRAAEEKAKGRDDREEFLEGIEAVRDRLEQFYIRMHSKADPADYAEAGFMLSASVKELVHRHYLEDAVAAYHNGKVGRAKGGRESGKTKRMNSEERYAPVREQINAYLNRKPNATASDIRNYLCANAGRLHLDRNNIPQKTKFTQLVKQEKDREK